LVLFMILGSLQLFLMLQARILAQVAVFRAVRAGSLNHGDCTAMKEAALATLLPTLPLKVGSAAPIVADHAVGAAQLFSLRQGNRYRDGNPVHLGQILELVRESPRFSDLSIPAIEDNRFDQWDRAGAAATSYRLEARMLYWYRLRIPFADWVISRMFLAHFNLQAYTATNPLMVAQGDSTWSENQPLGVAQEQWPGGSPATNLQRWASNGAYLVPIRVASAMRMMSPPRRNNFLNRGMCQLP
jgi:hypothetical protein